jgi:hypothetical protein
MERAAVSAFTRAAVAFADGLGERHHILDPAGVDTLEVLCLRDDLAAVPSFEFALRERVSRLSAFRHPSYGRIRAVERLTDRHATLAVVSHATTGTRLSDLLTQSAERRINLDIKSALCLIRELVPAVATLHEHARDIQGFAHGAIAPGRLIVTPDARLIVTEYAMGAALEQLHFPQERYWQELRVAVPRTAGLPRFDQRVDVTQIGIVALSLILGRLLRDEEYPARIGDVVASTWAISARGGFEPLPPGVRGWLGRALQLDPRSAFASAAEARAELEKLLGGAEFLEGPASLETFLARFHAADRPAPSIATDTNASDGPSAIRLKDPTEHMAAPDTRRTVEARPKADPREHPAPPEIRRTPEVRLKANAEESLPAPEVRRTAEVRLKADATKDAAPLAARPIADHDRDVLLFADQMPERPRVPRQAMIAAAVLVAVISGGFVARRQFFAAAPAVESTGTLVVTTSPTGVEALIDGELRGTTPITLTLAPGDHVVELRGGGEPRTLPVTVTAGMQASQHIELPRLAPGTGQLQIRTEPAGARVTIDGRLRGKSPLVVSDLSAGEHAVLLENDLGSVKEAVIIESGVTASLVVPLAAAPAVPASGWLSISAPFDVQIFEGGRLVGTNLTERIALSPGRHDVEIVNPAVGYRVERTLQVAPGRISSIALEMPMGTMALNALPWAEVWIDGEKIGETPIGNLPISVGSHSVVFRHPDLGEQHHTAVVTLQATTRVSVDLRKR